MCLQRTKRASSEEVDSRYVTVTKGFQKRWLQGYDWAYIQKVLGSLHIITRWSLKISEILQNEDYTEPNATNIWSILVHSSSECFNLQIKSQKLYLNKLLPFAINEPSLPTVDVYPPNNCPRQGAKPTAEQRGGETWHWEASMGPYYLGRVVWSP